MLAPFTMHRRILALIQRETRNAQQGKPARIIAKMNGLLEERVIAALGAASQAGVEIDLIVRGACALRPGVPGVTENIRVRSILGRFLEHRRVWYFENGGTSQVWLSSADWMGRNLFRRIEVAFPVLDPESRGAWSAKASRRASSTITPRGCWIPTASGGSRAAQGRARPLVTDGALAMMRATEGE